VGLQLLLFKFSTHLNLTMTVGLQLLLLFTFSTHLNLTVMVGLQLLLFKFSTHI